MKIISRITEYSLARSYVDYVSQIEALACAVLPHARQVLEKPSVLGLKNRRYDLAIVVGAPDLVAGRTFALSKGLSGCTRECIFLARDRLTLEKMRSLGLNSIICCHSPTQIETPAGKMDALLSLVMDGANDFIGVYDAGTGVTSRTSLSPNTGLLFVRAVKEVK